MPPLKHSVPSADSFDIKKSEAARWLCRQPEIMQKIFDMANRKGLISYDREAGVWKGVHYDD